MVVGEVSEPVDLLVIGGGPGGYSAALHGARLGRKVTLLESGRIGGTCLNVGCIPSKALIEASRHAALAGHGIEGVALTASVDMGGIKNHLDRTVDRLTRGVDHLLKTAGVEVVSGTAFASKPGRVVVEMESSVRHLDYTDLVLATGTTPATLSSLPVDGAFVVTSDHVFTIDELPQSLVVVGGGYIGVELGAAFARLGTKVTLVEAASRLLPEFPSTITTVVERGMKKLGVDVRLDTKATGAADGTVQLTTTHEDVPDTISTDLVMVAVGRTPTTATVGADRTGATVDARGLVVVDAQCRAADHVYAIGDITAGPALAHKAIAQAEVAVDAACGRPAAFNPAAVPMIVFGEPEVISVGYTVAAAEQSGLAVSSSRVPFGASGRARTMTGGEPRGFLELVSDNAGTVIGVHGVGDHIAELAGEASLAIEMAAALEDIAGTIHAHPTLGESVLEAALLGVGRPLHAG